MMRCGVRGHTPIKRPGMISVATNPSSYRAEREYFNELHLRDAAVDEQFNSRDITRVVRCEKYYRLCDLIGSAESPERNSARDHRLTLFPDFRRRSEQITQPRCVDGARADRVHPNAAFFQIGCPGPRKRSQRGFCRAINAVGREPFAGDNGGVQDDRGAIRQQRQRLLNREDDALNIDVEGRVIQILGNRTERRVPRKSGVREYNIQPFLISFDLSEQTIKISEIRHVPSHGDYIFSDLFYRSSQFRLAAARYDYVRAFVDELFRRGKANAAITTGYECNFSVEFTHMFSPYLAILSFCMRKDVR